MKKIGIIIAQLIEGSDFMKKLGEFESIETAGFSVRKYLYKGKEIYFTESGVGEIRAAISTQFLIDNYGVETIINFGVVGGLRSEMRGKVCIVEGVCHYDYDLSALDLSPRGKYEIFDSAVVPTDASIFSLLKEIAPAAQTVVCASGDKFVVDADFKKGLIDEFGASICEMEAAGILMTAKRSGIPCGIVKIVSDDGDHADEYYDFLEHMKDELSSIVIPLIEKL
ncbi:MAG: 5'-methylthioadenosine/S-adenosylhomocysteine nucleosidase [Clostridia bacterium]|nr:5'-methylthioadenosine/S-adenosylhomocysteine nucleosidase [Clostridia bacterium]